MPPRLEMKSSQVILRDLSNSEELEMKIDLCLQLHFPTKGSWTSKEDVHHSNVLLICVVVSLPLYWIINNENEHFGEKPGSARPAALFLGC